MMCRGAACSGAQARQKHRVRPHPPPPQGMCINARADPTSTHVPFRDSKLTRLLQVGNTLLRYSHM